MGTYDKLNERQQAYVDAAIFNAITGTTLGSDNRWNTFHPSKIAETFTEIRDEYAKASQGREVNNETFDTANHARLVIDAIVDNPSDVLSLYSSGTGYDASEIRQAILGLHRNADRLAELPEHSNVMDPLAYERLTNKEKTAVNLMVLNRLEAEGIEGMTSEEIQNYLTENTTKYASPIAWGFENYRNPAVYIPGYLTGVGQETRERAIEILAQHPNLAFLDCEKNILSFEDASSVAIELAGNDSLNLGMCVASEDVETNAAIHQAIASCKHDIACKTMEH